MKPAKRAAAIWSLVLVATSTGAAEPLPRAVVFQPKQREVAGFECAAQIVRPQVIQVRAAVSGNVAAIHVNAGSRVAAGDLLITLSSPWLDDRLRTAQASLQLHRGALDRAEREISRIAQLPEGSVAASDRERYAALRDLAAARVELARSELQRCAADLELAQVRAPVAGRIEAIQVAVGNVVVAGKSASTLLCTLLETDPIYVAIELEEPSYLRLRAAARTPSDDQPYDHRVRLALPDDATFIHPGVLRHADDELDPRSRTASLRAQFPEPDERLLSAALAAGRDARSVRLRFDFDEPRLAWFVPPQVLSTDSAGETIVLLVDRNDVIRMRRVRCGLPIDGFATILDGISDDDWVVLDTQRWRDPDTLSPQQFTRDALWHDVAPGTKVDVLRVDPPSIVPSRTGDQRNALPGR